MEIRTIGIVGAGQMGCGIAQIAARSGFDVVLTDIDAAILDAGRLGRKTGRGFFDSTEG
jgi:3-hydroxybutyryl-CoA dehydrogenase